MVKNVKKKIKKSLIKNTWWVTGCGVMGLVLYTIWLDAGDIRDKCNMTAAWLGIVLCISLVVYLDRKYRKE